MKRIHLILFSHLLLGVLAIVFFDGTGDAGDSVYHYLYAHYAPIHNWLFLDHWAKPIYVLIASPFAQLGFVGVKILNLILINATLYFTFRLAKIWEIKNSILTSVFLIFSPLYFVLTFSGLTEPLFAFFLILSLLLMKQNHLFWACLIISFLPFVRSEGLLFIGLFGLWLLWYKKWVHIIVLGAGSVTYALVGWNFYGDLLWVFNRIPYANLEEKYGSGSIFHLIYNLINVVGLPIYILFWFGIIGWVKSVIQKQAKHDLSYFIFGGIFIFIVAHSLFWYLGIFSSMGLIRVLICILPLVSIVAVIGYNYLTKELLYQDLRVNTIAQYFIVGLIVFWFFIPSNLPGSIDVKRKLELTLSQEMINEVAGYLEKKEGDYRLVTNHPYLCEVMNFDCFDKSKKIFLKEKTLDDLRKNDIIIWESWLSVTEQKLHKSVLENDDRLERVFEVKRRTQDGREKQFLVYEVKLEE